MMHVIRNIEVMYPENIKDSFIPQHVKKNVWYKVIVEKTNIRTDTKRGKIEDLFFGIINENAQLVFGASFNFKIRVLENE